jgi:antitoxin HicB
MFCRKQTGRKWSQDSKERQSKNRHPVPWRWLRDTGWSAQQDTQGSRFDAQGHRSGVKGNAMLEYPILPHEDGGYIVGRLPDFPECNPIGRTIEEMLEDAVNSLEEIIAAKMEDREPLPLPSKDYVGYRIALPLTTIIKMAIYMNMREQGITKADLARKLSVNQKVIDRLLDLNHHTRIESLERALRALGKKVEVEIKSAA